jgi:GNAT superfamily N-acetyltransferase
MSNKMETITDSLFLMIEDNVLAYYKGLAQSLGGRFVENETISWFTTGKRSLMRFNGVLRMRASPGEHAALVDPLLDYFQSNHLPFFCADYPPGSIPGLGQYLESHGVPLAAREMPAMQRSLDSLPSFHLPKQAEITEVRTLQDQMDWLEVHMQGFNEPETARADFRQYLNHSLTESPSAWRHFLVRWQGEPCAISTLLCAPKAAGIYHVTTLPAYRGRGFGRALTLAAMQAGREQGCTSAVLFATPEGYPLYKKLGFETVVTADLYAWIGERIP